ncbi:DUF6207 family protein [Streptomyces sp. BBFR25]|uniref:DUF6207 family protein n=1 Tax=Streptomyces sp. BBFR25 TaxID=3372855 RepID=UPI0037DCC7D7
MRGRNAVNEVYGSEPGLVVVDVAAAGDAFAFAFHTVSAARWATDLGGRTYDAGCGPTGGEAALLP